MLEILLLWFLTKQIGKLVEKKGRKSIWFKVMVVGFWIGGELMGMILGMIVAGSSESATCIWYAFALAGAGLGAGAAFVIAAALPTVEKPPEPAPLQTPPLPWDTK